MTKHEREQFGKICQMAIQNMMFFATKLGCADTPEGKITREAHTKITEIMDALGEMQRDEQRKTNCDRLQDAIFIMDEIRGKEPRKTAKKALECSINNLARKADLYY